MRNIPAGVQEVDKELLWPIPLDQLGAGPDPGRILDQGWVQADGRPEDAPAEVCRAGQLRGMSQGEACGAVGPAHDLADIGSACWGEIVETVPPRG
jgi:hypothetical protein